MENTFPLQTVIKMQFDPDVAKDVGTDAAIIFSNIEFWVITNQMKEYLREDKPHFNEGKWWTYSTIFAFESFYPYLTYNQIRTCLDKLKDKGYLITGNFNETLYDKTLWYAIGQKYYERYKTHCGISHIEEGNHADRSENNPTPNTYNKPNDKPYIRDNTTLVKKGLTPTQKQALKDQKKLPSWKRPPEPSAPVEESEYPTLDSVTKEVRLQVARETETYPHDVRTVFQSLEAYCKANSKTYHDYKAALTQFVLSAVRRGEIAKEEITEQERRVRDEPLTPAMIAFMKGETL